MITEKMEKIFFFFFIKFWVTRRIFGSFDDLKISLLNWPLSNLTIKLVPTYVFTLCFDINFYTLTMLKNNYMWIQSNRVILHLKGLGWDGEGYIPT